MKIVYRLLSTIVLSAFLFNTVFSDLAFSQIPQAVQKRDNLAPPLLIDDIISLERQDAGRIGLIVNAYLFNLTRYNGDVLTVDIIRDVHEDYSEPVDTYGPADVQLLLRETISVPQGAAIECRVTDSKSKLPRKYHAVFSLTKSEFNEFKVRVYTENDFNKKKAMFPKQGSESPSMFATRQGDGYNTGTIAPAGKEKVKKTVPKNEDTRLDKQIEDSITKIRSILDENFPEFTGKTVTEKVDWNDPLTLQLSDGSIMIIDRAARDKVVKDLPKVLKEYDVRGLDDVFTPEMLVLLGMALGTSNFNSHHGTEGLNAGDIFLLAGDNGPTTPKMRKYLAEGLRLTGVNVVDLGLTVGGELYNGIFRIMADGGAYVTRSHVEVGTNGFKPLVGNTTLYAEMIQVLGTTISNGEFRIPSKSSEMGKIITADSDLGKNIHDISREVYRLNLLKEFAGIQKTMASAGIKVAIDFAGGSATQYVSLAKEMLGDRLVETFGTEQDPYCKNGLPDPSREDMLGDIIELSKKSPDVIWFSYDLDTDRMAIVQDGRLFKGDLLFYPLVEDVLRNGDGMQKDFLYDARMVPAIAELVENLGGVAKIHPKGHSKIKRTVEIAMKELAKAKGYKTVLEMVQATGHHDFQMEYSLHPFVTTEKGACIDDAFRFTFWWIKGFAAMKKASGDSSLTLAQYLEKLQEQKLVSKWYSLSEQRTDMQEEFKKDLMNKMRDTVLEAFKGRDDFEFVNWTDYKGQKKPFTLVDTEGVYYFMTPAGIFYWGWSNTSAKVALGAHSKSDAGLNSLSKIMLGVFYALRDSMQTDGEAKGVNIQDASRHIQDKETGDLLKLMSGKSNIEVEAGIKAKYPTLNQAITGLLGLAEAGQAQEKAGPVASPEIEEAFNAAKEAGIAIPTHQNSRYTLLVTSEFFANGELAAHQMKYGDRFELDSVSGVTVEQFVANVLAKSKNRWARTIVLVPDSLPKEALQSITATGVRVIRVKASELLYSKVDNDPERAKFQLDTYAMMLLARAIDKDTPKDSAIYRVLSFFLRSHFKLEDKIAVDDYINALAKDDVTRLIKGCLIYKPAEAYRAPEYNTVAAALISA